LLHAILKKEDKISVSDKRLAIKRMKNCMPKY